MKNCRSFWQKPAISKGYSNVNYVNTLFTLFCFVNILHKTSQKQSVAGSPVNYTNRNDQQEKNESPVENILSSFKRYKSSLKYFISSYAINPQDVDDVCQETFLRTYKSSLDKDIQTPKSFMFKVAKNLIFSDFRSASTQLNEYVADIDIVESNVQLENLENNTLAQEKLGIMCEAIAGLPNKCRQAVIMRKVYGLSTKDVALRMNISTVTVSNYITRGMCAYNDAIEQYNEENTHEYSGSTSAKKSRVS